MSFRFDGGKQWENRFMELGEESARSAEITSMQQQNGHISITTRNRAEKNTVARTIA